MNLIIDASNIFHRSFWMSSKNNVDQSDKELGSFHTYIFLRSLKSYCDKFKPTAVYCVWDKKQEPHVPCFRKVVASDTYKTNRDKEHSKRVYEDYDIVEKFINSLGCYNVFPFSLEADDAIAFLCNNLKSKNIIVSSDKDLLQLISNDTTYYDVNKKDIINLSNFEQMNQIDFNSFVHYKCLIGDPADNIARIVSPSKAKKVINGSLELTVDQQQQFKSNFDLIDLKDSYSRQPGELQKMQQYFSQLNTCGSFKNFVELCNEYNMHNILSKKDEWQQTFFANKTMHNIVNFLKGE